MRLEEAGAKTQISFAKRESDVWEECWPGGIRTSALCSMGTQNTGC